MDKVNLIPVLTVLLWAVSLCTCICYDKYLEYKKRKNKKDILLEQPETYNI